MIHNLFLAKMTPPYLRLCFSLPTVLLLPNLQSQQSQLRLETLTRGNGGRNVSSVI